MQKWVDTGTVAGVEVLALLHQESDTIAEAVVGAGAQEDTVHVQVHPLALQGTEADQDTESIPASSLVFLRCLVLQFYLLSLLIHVPISETLDPNIVDNTM